jgi:hypothetical protein
MNSVAAAIADGCSAYRRHIPNSATNDVSNFNFGVGQNHPPTTMPGQRPVHHASGQEQERARTPKAKFQPKNGRQYTTVDALPALRSLHLEYLTPGTKIKAKEELIDNPKRRKGDKGGEGGSSSYGGRSRRRGSQAPMSQVRGG